MLKSDDLYALFKLRHEEPLFSLFLDNFQALSL